MKTDNKYINIPHFLIVLKSMSGGDKTISTIFRETKITLAHLYNIKKELLKLGLIKMVDKDEGRKGQIPALTNSGIRIVQATNIILDELDIRDYDINNNLIKSKKEGLQSKNKDSEDDYKSVSAKDKEELDKLIKENFQL